MSKQDTRNLMSESLKITLGNPDIQAFEAAEQAYNELLEESKGRLAKIDAAVARCQELISESDRRLDSVCYIQEALLGEGALARVPEPTVQQRRIDLLEGHVRSLVEIAYIDEPDEGNMILADLGLD